MITVELNRMLDGRPSAFTAACTPVFGAAAVAAPSAFVTAAKVPASGAGHRLAGGEWVTPVAQAEIQWRYAQMPKTTVSGISGSAAKDLPTAKSVDAVRGVPPRGRPV